MQKWSNGAKKRKAVIDAAEVKSNDMDAIVSAIAGIAPRTDQKAADRRCHRRASRVRREAGMR